MSESSLLNEDLSFQSFIEQVHKDYEQTQRDLKEIDLLIQQSAGEVERLVQRNAQTVNRVRQMDNNIQTLPRDYIRETYDELANVQQRLFTMRGQLEKLQSDQRNLERLTELQYRITQQFSADIAVTSSEEKPRSTKDQSIAIRVIQTEEAEKKSLVRRMHDGPASSLSNFILQAEICQRFFDIDPDRARTELNSLKSAAASTFNYVKDFIFDLRPMMLDDLGVVPTTRRYIESFQEKSDIPVSFTITGAERRLEGHIEVTIFRTVQGLLINAHAHSQPSQIQVSLDLAQNKVTAVVEDNGSGFNVEEALSGNSGNIGLPTMRERINMLGGELNIQSSLGKGTRAEFIIPIASEELVF